MRSITSIALTALLIAGSAEVSAKGPVAPDPAQIVWINGFYDKMDADGDSKVTRLEMGSYGSKAKLGGTVRQKVWLAMDLDRNGWVSREEMIRNALAYEGERASRAR